MKKLLIFILFIPLLFSCKKDNTDTQPKEITKKVKFETSGITTVTNYIYGAIYYSHNGVEKFILGRRVNGNLEHTFIRPGVNTTLESDVPVNSTVYFSFLNSQGWITVKAYVDNFEMWRWNFQQMEDKSGYFPVN